MGRELAVEPAALTSRLERYAREVLRDERPIVLGDRLSGGWSVDTFRVDIGDDVSVLRIADSEHPLDTSPAREARIFPRAKLAGVPAPTLLVAEDNPDWLGGPFSLVSYVEGQAPNVWSARRMDAFLNGTGADVLLGELADIAVRIRTMPVGECAAEPPSILGMRPDEYSIATDVQRWVEKLESTIVARPALTLGGAWLVANAPEPDEVVFQHHDFRLGNVLFGDGGQALAVLDWEFSGAGDPLCDIGYAAQPYSLGRLLHARPRLDTKPDPTTALLDAYADRAPATPDRDRMRYFVALGIFKMAVALALTADEWWSGRGGRRDAWLEVPILSLSDDLVAAIRGVG